MIIGVWVLWLIALFIWSLLIGGIDRKIVAHLQGRYGPPFWQDITDFLKLFRKRGKTATRSSSIVSDIALIIGIIAVVLGLSILPMPTVGGYTQLLSTSGDLIILAYVFALLAIVYVLIGFGGKSPYTMVGASREVSMLLSYEFPFILVIVAMGYRAILLTGLPVSTIFSIAGFLVLKQRMALLLLDPIFLGSFLVLLILGPAIVGAVPFDIPEAETEIVDGYGAEMHGPRLGVLFGIKHMKLLLYAYFLWTIFLSPVTSNIWLNIVMTLLGTLLMVLVIYTVPRAVSGRFRVEQGAKFYLLGPGLASIVLLLLSLI